MKVGVVSFPGSNCDEDALLAVVERLDERAVLLWHKDHDLQGADVIILPGGFSYGDYLRAGAIARFSPIMQEVIEHAKRGGPVIGICNGFQIACEAGLLPGALMTNAGLQFICKDVNLRVETTQSEFTRKYRKGQTIRVPVAHHDGNYTLDADAVKKLEDEDRIAFRYADPLGNVAAETNLNGSVANIAGIYNARKTVLGLMPHPENATDPICGGMDGYGLFESIAESLA